VAKLVPATCPKCGANVQLDPDREFVTCQFCGASSFIQTQKRPVTQYVHAHAMPVIHVPRAAGLASGCGGAVALIGGLVGVGAAVAAVLLLFVSSKPTSTVAPSFDTTTKPKPGVVSQTDTPSAPLVEEDYFANPALAKARYEQVLGKPIMARQLSLMQYYATLEAQDPKNKDHVDSYKLWANKVERPQPVRLSGSDKTQLDKNLISLESVDFRVVPKVIKAALADLKLEDSKVAVVLLDRDSQGQHEPIWRVIVNGSRDNGVVEFSVAGEKLRSFQ
jgi:hypothetical protein